ncbi:MAG: bioA [Chloroflexi bacterium]|nr:bioA [Chloroflexota bacterium]
MSVEADDKHYLWHPFTQQEIWEAEPQLVIDRADGCYLFDSEGRRYLDGVSSLWVTAHGHRRAEINAAIIDQLDRVAHTTFLGLTHEPATKLARRLVELAPGHLRRVFYSDTGAAAVEIALKMAFQYWQQTDPPRPSKTRFFSLNNDYHGDTVGAMSVGGVDLYHALYKPLLFPIYQEPGAYCYRCHLRKSYPSCGIACLDQVKRTIAAHADELAAVVMEPMIQAAAGMIAFPPGYTRAIRETAREHDVLFIVDEVATGFGRTGTMFACEQEGIEPDLMAIGKGLSGGYLPLAATLATEEIYRAFLGPIDSGRTFYHGHTYTGNPVACAAALASLDLFETERTLDKLQPRISQLTEGLRRLETLRHVGNVRQRGFMAGVELVRDVDSRQPFPAVERVGHRVCNEARARGLILRPLGNVIAVMPPLVISEAELSFLLDVVEESVRAVTESPE